MKRTIVFHPFLFAAYPVLFLFAHNLNSILTNDIFLPLIISISLTAVSFLFLSLILKDPQKGGLIISAFVVLFFTYGALYQAIHGLKLGNLSLGRYRYLLPLYGAMFLGASFLTIRMRPNPRNLTRILNFVALFLIFVSIAQIVSHNVRFGYGSGGFNAEEKVNKDALRLGKPPNIYYIIVDAYARADVLEEMYSYDNSDFIDFLEEKDFYVASKGTTNYADTVLSLASSLNMTYLDKKSEELEKATIKLPLLVEMIKKSKVRSILTRQGYKFVAFDSGCSYTNINDASTHYLSKGSSLTEFMSVLLNMTPVPFIADQLSNSPILGDLSFYDSQRSRILFTLDNLVDTTRLEDPIFVYAHILAPHPPFVFDEDGNPENPELQHTGADGDKFPDTRKEYIEGYRKQLTFINGKLEIAVSKLIAESRSPLIIIIQGDHGPRSSKVDRSPDSSGLNPELREEFSILNAYYFSDENYEDLYESITPVNSFRAILPQYLGADYKLLQDRNFSTSFTGVRPYEFTDVTKEVR